MTDNQQTPYFDKMKFWGILTFERFLSIKQPWRLQSNLLLDRFDEVVLVAGAQPPGNFRLRPAFKPGCLW